MKTSVLGKLFRKFRTRDSRWRCQGQDARGLHSLRANIAQRARATPVTVLRIGQNRLLQAGGCLLRRKELTRMDRIDRIRDLRFSNPMFVFPLFILSILSILVNSFFLM